MQYLKENDDIVVALGLSEEQATAIEQSVEIGLNKLYKKVKSTDTWNFNMVIAECAHIAETPEQAFYLATVIAAYHMEANIIQVEQLAKSN